MPPWERLESSQRLRDMNYIGFNHQRENKPKKNDEYIYSINNSHYDSPLSYKLILESHVILYVFWLVML
jgi:hypothetical protein